MQTPDPIRRDLSADLEPEESEPLVGLGARLQARRPTPAAAFRGELRGALLGAPARPLALAASYAAAGALLLAVAAAGLAGAGPLAPG